VAMQSIDRMGIAVFYNLSGKPKGAISTPKETDPG